jgi:hypothetical protein
MRQGIAWVIDSPEKANHATRDIAGEKLTNYGLEPEPSGIIFTRCHQWTNTSNLNRNAGKVSKTGQGIGGDHITAWIQCRLLFKERYPMNSVKTIRSPQI